MRLVGTVRLERGYYYCAQCVEGVISKDRELDVEGTSFSTGTTNDGAGGSEGNV